MKLIVGLGNPEKKYFSTRHNVGFLSVDNIRESLLHERGVFVSDWKNEKMFNSEISFVSFNSENVAILLKPLTYMNCSGEAVSKVVKKYDIVNLTDNLILIYDDLDIKFGSFKIQIGKSPKSHNGVNNVIEMVRTDNFKNVRIGIENRLGRPIKGEDFVLMNFSKDEEIALNEVLVDVSREIVADILSI